ncbi:MAG: tetratricopeptide repeat protein [Proteobacteria bacterium]|nr:tetratricopeptide repeat protein [Pseudomonadota bacterium]
MMLSNLKRHFVAAFFLLLVMIASSCAPPSYIKQNDLLITRGRADEAIENYKRLIDEDPENHDVYYRLAKTRLQTGSFDEAKTTIRTAILLEPLMARYQLLAGKINYHSGDYFEAINHFSTSLVLNNRFLESYYLLALAYEKTGKVDTALEQLEAAIAIEPLYFDAHLAWISMTFDLAVEKSNASSETVAFLIPRLENALKIKPRSVDGHLLLSRIHRFMGATHKAKSILLKCLKEFGHDDRIMLALTKMEFQAGRFEEASRMSQKIKKPTLDSEIIGLKIRKKTTPDTNLADTTANLLSKHPLSKELLLLSAELELSRGNLVKAERLIQKGLDIDPDYAEAYLRLFEVREVQNDPKGARWALRKALDLAPESPDIKIRYLKRLVQEGKWDEIETFLENRNLDPQNPEVIFLKGLMAKEKGDYSKAEQLFRDAQTKQYSARVEIQLADIEIGQGKFQSAETRLKRIDALFPDNLEIVLVKAKLLLHSKRIDEIPPLLQPHLENVLGHGKVQLLLAESLAQRGKIEKATKVLGEGLRRWPRHPDLAQAYTFYLEMIEDYPKAIGALEDMQTHRHKYNRLFFHRLRAYYFKAGNREKFENYLHLYPD